MKKKISPSTRVTRSRLGAVPRHAPYTTSTPVPETTFDPTLPITGENVPSQQMTTIIDPTFVMLPAPLPPLPTSDGEEEDGTGQEEGATCLGYATPPSRRAYLTKEEEELKREEKYLIEAEKHVQQLRQTFELHSSRIKEKEHLTVTFVPESDNATKQHRRLVESVDEITKRRAAAPPRSFISHIPPQKVQTIGVDSIGNGRVSDYFTTPLTRSTGSNEATDGSSKSRYMTPESTNQFNMKELMKSVTEVVQQQLSHLVNQGTFNQSMHASQPSPSAPQQMGEYALLKHIKMPHFKGYKDDQTPSEFITSFERFLNAHPTSNQDTIVRKYMQCAMEGEALNWYNFQKQHLTTWEAFKKALIRKYAATNYQERLSRELRDRTQHYEEPLTSYVQVMQDYHEKLDEYTADKDRVKRVLKQMHPEYRHYMEGYDFRNLHDMYEVALEVQEHVLNKREYKPPPDAASSVEPSLAFTPKKKERKFNHDTPPATKDVQEGRKDLHEVSIDSLDPHRSRRRSRFHEEADSRKVVFHSPGRDGGDGAKSPVNTPRTTSILRDTSGERYKDANQSSRESSAERRITCYGCGEVGHISRECPNKNKRPRSPSGTGDRGASPAKNDRAPPRN